jgi:hypothetical protein
MKNTRAILFADLLNAFSVCKIALSQLCWLLYKYINLQHFLFKASKEWRVVTDYLERLCSNVKTGTDSLVQVSTG